MSVKGTEIVEKRNVLNEIRQNNMTLQELRFFSIYLSKINARDTNSRNVLFPLSDFQKIMGFGRMNIAQLKNTTDSLLQKIVSVPNADGSRGYTSFQLFKRCKVFENENQWFIEINANDEALPLMFDFKREYFTYELWNALRLKSSNQVRMYELLKQYEKLGKREITITDLRELLGIDPKEYPRWDRFRVRVLDSCQEALAENTDIKFTYERGKTGNGGKWLTIIFHISKNKNHKDELSLSDFIDIQSNIAQIQEDIIDVEPIQIEETPTQPQYSNENIELLAEACNNEFNELEMQEITSILCTIAIPPNQYGNGGIWIDRYHYLAVKYAKLNYEKARLEHTAKPMKNRYKYFLKIIKSID